MVTQPPLPQQGLRYRAADVDDPQPETTPPPAAPPRWQATYALPADVSAAGRARALLEQHLRQRLPDAGLDDAKLVASELVTNAVEHGCGGIELRATLLDDRLRLEVVDGGHGAPRVREQAGEDGGWGLRIVEALSVRWGAFEGTTHVWADLPVA